MDAFDNPALNGMTGPERDSASSEPSNRAVAGGEFLTAAANVTAAATAMPLAIQAILVPDASGRIVLPAGASIDDITISGTDLVITLPNGQVFIIPGGAVDVPAIVVDGDTVPASTVAQLLENLGELNPEAGVRSSGGNFADPEGPIQDAYALGDLLPYTQLAFPQPEERELLPDVPDEEPTIVIVTPDQPAGVAAATASVNEAGLPARGNEPAGSNSAANSETTTGSIVYDAGDGLDTLTINGTAITAVGQVITTPLGQLTITSLTPGNIGYSYTLTDNTNANNNLTDPFTVVVTDNDGDTATATLTISVVDDVPTARNDTDQVAAGSFAPESGNVLTGAGTTSGATGADTPGADGASLTGIRGASSEGGFSAPGTVQGQYGTLTINAQGGYTYVRNPGTPGGVNDVFNYQITDGDGDTSTATLTISIADAPTVITFVPGDGEGDGGTIVYEADLGPREGETPGSAFVGGEGGSDASTSGTITFTAVDGIGSVSIGGVVVTPGSLPQTISSDATGTLVVTGYSYDPATGAGSITYVYTLIDNTLDGDGTTVSFDLVVTDADGDAASDTLDIDIVDDVPTARADSDSVTEDGPTTADGNVLTGNGGEDANGTDGVADVQGADGATVTAVAGGAVGEPVAGTYGSLTLNSDGSYNYVLNNASQPVQGLAAGETLTETFTYTITDGDGDTSTTTLTITINGADDGVTINGLNVEGGEVVVDEDNLPDGSSPDAAALTQGGSFTISTPDGLGNVTIGGTQVVTNGVFAAGTATSPLGLVNITGFTPVLGTDGSVIGGTFTYEYVLSDNTLTHTSEGEDSVTDSFAVVVTDSDGSSANASLDVRIVDDVPTGRNDVDSVTEDSGDGDNPPVADGNVLTGLGGGDANATDGVADTQGADGATVTAVTGGSLGEPFAGAYGSLTLNSDGSYRYVLNNQAQPVQGLSAGETLTETFTYTITDGDGDTATATLTITINGADDGVIIRGLDAEGAEVIVNEDDLADGSSPDAAALTQTSNFSISTPDGLGNVTIGGTQVVTNGVFTAGTATSPLGTVNITGFTPVIGADGSVIGGTFTYNYVLSDNTLTHSSEGEDFVGDSFAVVVTDSDGSSANASLDVRIIDDVPTATNDSATAAEDAPVVINVLANDVRGADGVNPATGVALATAPGKGSVVYNGDGTFTYTPTAGQEGTDSFTYTITDNDGDTSTATVTVTLAKDSVPTINLGADNSVNEAGLPAGSNAASNSETATGSFTLTTGNDSVASLVINGVDVTTGGTVTTPTGVLTVTLSGGAYSYSYTLTTNTSGDDTFDSFTAVVTDSDGDTATDTLVIDIIDDVPTARADVDSVTEDGPLTADGNVLSGSGGTDANATDGVDDIRGADGASVTGISFGATVGSVGTPLAGAYGTLTLNADGSYSYVLNNAAQPVQGLSAGQTLTETFTYTITDGDTDTSTTTLTITINGADDGVTINGLNAEGAELFVDEDDLPVRPGEAPGSDATPDGVTDSDSFTVSTPDGMGTVVLNSFNGVGFPPLTLVVANGNFTSQSVTTAYGKLDITGFTPVTGADGSVIGGTFTYTYTLTDNRTDHPAAGQDNRTDSVGVTVTDIDGSTANATIDIRITDDVPDAINDAATQTVENAPVTVNVLANDIQGADSVQPSAVQLVAGSLTGTGTLVNNGNGTFTYTAGAQETGTVTFQYRITDGDGDTDIATATITLVADSAPQIRTPINVTVDEDGLAGANADNGLPGEVTSTGSASANGTIIVNFGSDVPATLGGSLVLNDSAALDTQLTVGGVPVTFAKVGNDLVGSVAGNEVIRIALTTAAAGPGATEVTYGYTVTLAQAIDQAVAGSEDTDFLPGIGFTVTDSDGTQSSGSFGVTIVDDLPTLNISDTPVSVVEGATASGTWTLDRGADGVGSVNVAFGSGSATLSLAPGSSVSITQPTGTLTVNANGTFSFAAAGNQNNAGNPSASFTLSAVDRDGDPTSDSLTIAITDGANPTGATPITLTVNEAALADGSNPASNAETTSGNLSFTAGSDTLSGFAFTGVAGLVANLDGAGTDIFWTLAPGGQTITGSLTPGGPAAITISLTAPASIASGATANATVTVTLADNLPHALANAAQTQALGNVTVQGTDTDGDVATGVVTVQVTDDVPTARADVDSVTEDGATVANGNVLTGVGGNDANNTDGVADTRGADGATVTGLAGGTVGTPLVSTYGTLTLNSDGSYSYALNNANTAVQGLSAGQTLTEIFTYTITDGDGDPSTTTLTITINGANDGVTINGLNVPGGEEIVNEDDLTDGSSPDAAALTQTGSFTVTAPDGLNNVTVGTAQVMTNGVFTPGLTTTSPLGTVTITGFTPVTASDGSVIGGTFSYSYTLADNTLTHPAAGEDSVSDSFAVTVTDSDGSSANASLDITVIDDVPTASAEANQNVAEGATVIGTLDFVQGADGATVTQINGTVLVFGGDGFSQTIDIGAGTIKVKADGSYSFTADATVPGTGTASATYTVRDGDGDTSTAPISFTITDANVPTAGQTLASVDDDALVGGNPASTVGDLADPNSDGDNNQATFSGLLNLNFGGDGAGSVNFAAMNGLFVNVGQESVQLAWNAGTNTLTGTGPRGALFTVEVTNPATGAYKVTLLDNVLHTAGGNENDATATLGFTVIDSDGSTANGTLQITFDDDAPTVVANTTQPTLTVDESAFGTDASASFASVFTPTFGADGAAATNSTTYALGIAAGSTGLVDSLTNQAVVLSVVGGVVQGRTATSNDLVFTVSVAANGAVTLDQIRAVMHSPNSGPNQSTSLSADNLITLTATVTDADGDTATATANIGQNLVFNDDAPVANDDAVGLTEGGPISVTFDVDTNDSDGADGFGSRSFTSLTGTYGTITLNGDGTQTYTLNATGQAAIAALAPGATLTDVFTYTLTDKDGDSDPATLTVTLTGDDDGVTITNLTPAAQGGDVTVDEDDLPNGSSPNAAALTATGTFNISAPDGVANLSVHGTQVIANGVFTAATITTPLGNTLNITAYNAATGQITYSYTLTGAETHDTGAGQNSLFENFTVSLTDTDGDNTTGTLSVNIVDDVPTAVNDTDSIAAGSFGPATGNVITDAAPGDAGDSDTGADTRGADGAAVSAIASVNVPANSDTAADGLGNFQVGGQYGVLTINADGSYSYTRNAGTAGGVSDVFTYTLRDADGDTATATLTISIADAAPVTAANATVLLDDDALPGGNAGGTGDDVNSANTPGTLSGSGGDGALTFAFQTTGAPAGFTYELSGSNLLVKQGATTVLTVTLNPANGAYSVTQNAPIIHPAGLDENNQPFTLTYSVTDIDGDAATGTLGINVDDDTPTVTLTAVNESNVLLTTQDAETIGALTDTAVSTANFGGVFTLTSGYGADGAGTTTVGYALALVGANGTDSTLDSNGASIFLYTGAGGTIVGSTSATAGGVNAGNTIFTLGVNTTTGVVTLTQFAEIDHAPNSDTSAPYDDQFASLANGLVRLNGTATITDADGDSQTSTAFVDLGGNIRFADDGPSIAAGTPLPTLTVDESNFGINAVGAAVFTTNHGADGPGTVTYALGINAGSTGLVDTLTGQNVVLTLVGGQVVATAGNGGPTVFTVAVDASGNITLDQIRAIAHDTDGGPGAAHDDAKTLAAANLITITGTITDGDGDSAQASINIGQRLTFKDDGPTTTADSGTTTEATLDFNAAFVLDFSGSIDDTELNTMLNAVRDAGLLLFANSSGDVSIRLIGFSSGAANLGVFTDPVSFVNAIDDLNPAQGGTRYANGNTDFTAGIQQLMSVYVPDPTASNQVFFLSDGNPNEQTGPGGSSLTAAVATQWNSFVNDNDVNVTAIGVGNGITTARLQDIDVDGQGAPILAADFDDLVQTLLDIVVALPVTGDLDANDNFGGDGGRIQSITINGTTYTWDGNNTITRTGTLTGNVSGNSITATTPNGASLSLNFATGIWSYAPPENPTVGSEVFNYSVVDGDGDTAGSTLTVTVAAGGGPGAGAIAIADMVITNATGSGAAIQIAEAALLANDQAGTTITGAASNVTDAASVTRGGGFFTFADNDNDGGSFFYSTTPSDSARVTVDRSQAGENTLDGTSANDILIGRDANADTILAGDGNDYLYGLGGNDTLTGGLGADTMSGGAGADTFVINTGHSRAILGGSGNAGTISGFDRITDFDIAADTLNLQGSPFAVANSASTNGTDSVLTVGGQTIKSHSITNGVITFDDANPFAGALTLTTDAHVAAAVDYLQRNDLGNGGATVAFVVGGRTFVYEQVGNSPNANNDILVELQGVSLANLTTLIGSRVTPVTLDLDGDGLQYVSSSAGVAFDYDGDGVREATSWAGRGDGILVRDANGDGIANNASEISFSVAGSTDLEGLRLQYDSNGDGKLSAEDTEFASFGVWQDANGNGITDAGEFRSLSDLGIASLALTSDGKPYIAADGEVIVHGEASFTRTDGSTSAVGDVSFITPRAANDVERTAGNQALTSSLVAASLIVAVQDTQPDNAAPAIVAAEDAPSVAQADSGDAAVAADAPSAATPANAANDSHVDTSQTAASDTATLHSDEASPAAIDGAQDSGWRSETADNSTSDNSDALADMIADRGSADTGTMDGLLSLAAAPAEAAVADAAAHDPAADAVLAEVLESGDSAVDQLIHAVTGGHEPVQIAAGDAPAFDLAQLLDQKIAPDVAFPTSQPLETELHNMVAA
jgi:VCBS repeat-containing protein